MRRFTRLTNAFSKKLENHAAQVALQFWYYNCCRKHATIKTAAAVAAGVARYSMDLVDLVRMLDAAAPKPNRPKTYRRRGPNSGAAHGSGWLRCARADTAIDLRQVPVAVAEIVLQVVALVLQGVEPFILDLPTRPRGAHQLDRK